MHMTLEDVRNDTEHTEYICQFVDKDGEVDFRVLSREQILTCDLARFYFNGGYKR